MKPAELYLDHMLRAVRHIMLEWNIHFGSAVENDLFDKQKPNKGSWVARFVDRETWITALNTRKYIKKKFTQLEKIYIHMEAIAASSRMSSALKTTTSYE